MAVDWTVFKWLYLSLVIPLTAVYLVLDPTRVLGVLFGLTCVYYYGRLKDQMTDDTSEAAGAGDAPGAEGSNQSTAES